MMGNIEKQGVWIAKKKIKICIRHSQKNLRHYIRCVVFKGVFNTHLNIHDGAFFAKAVNGFWPLIIFSRKSALSYMFDWVLNRPMVLTDSHSISLILKLLRQKKFVYSRVGYELADKRYFCGFVLFLVAVTAIYCINPWNVELFLHT